MDFIKKKQKFIFSSYYQIITEWLYVPISNGENVAIHISYKIKQRLIKYVENFYFYDFFPTPDYADSDRPTGPTSFTVAVQTVEAGGNCDGNLLIFTSKKPATSF